VVAWWREPVSYNGHFTIDDDGEPDLAFDEAGVIGEAAVSRSACAVRARRIVAVDGVALVARGRD
jgi:hypothetical protein